MNRSATSLGQVRYASSRHAWTGYTPYVQDLIVGTGARQVLELGGGANPAIPLAFLRDHGVDYTVLDISPGELAKAPAGYRKVCADIGSTTLAFGGLEARYELVFSKMLAEHVRNGEQMHRNVFRLLAPGGRAVHYFPTLYAPPFVLNRLLPESLTDHLLQWLEPGREKAGKKGKFPAYYSWCRGPTHRQLARLQGLGYKVDQYIGFFGHESYYQRVPGLLALHRQLSGWLTRHPVPALTSACYVVLSKPALASRVARPAALAEMHE